MQVQALSTAVEANGAGIQHGKALGCGTLVRLAACTGLRWSEPAGLRVKDIDFGRGPHELRRTAASLAISAGANVKAVQRMLGHASAEVTLDADSDLFDDLDDVAVCLGRAALR